MTGRCANSDHWSLDDIPLDRVEIERVRPRGELFLLPTGASFVETGSELYARNLVDHLQGDADVTRWLIEHWEPQELQHGRALRADVNRWSESDWQAAFVAFFADYSRRCTTDELEPTPCLEMAARCVVEMGTATYYRAMQALADEPVLGRLAGMIQHDEVCHYKHFLHYFTRYNAIEHNSRMTLLGALARRLQEFLQSDAECGARISSRCRTHNSTGAQAISDAHAVKMLLKPLALPPIVNRFSCAQAKWAQRLILR